MIAIIVPAHNAQDQIDACLAALVRASRHPALAAHEVQITVVLDRCDDRSGWLARSWGVQTMDVQAGNPSAARKAGADAAVRAGATWLAFADADTEVAEDWLAAQIAQRGSLVNVAVHDAMFDVGAHPHCPATNFGLSAEAYAAACVRMAAAGAETSPATSPLVAWSPSVPTVARPAFGAPTIASGGAGPKTVLQNRHLMLD